MEWLCGGGVKVNRGVSRGLSEGSCWGQVRGAGVLRLSEGSLWVLVCVCVGRRAEGCVRRVDSLVFFLFRHMCSIHFKYLCGSLVTFLMGWLSAVHTKGLSHWKGAAF